MSAFPSPAETVMAFDAQPGNNRFGGLELVVNRHNGGPNICFADGHVKWINGPNVSTLGWSPAGAGPMGGPGGLTPPPGAPPAPSAFPPPPPATAGS